LDVGVDRVGGLKISLEIIFLSLSHSF